MTEAEWLLVEAEVEGTFAGELTDTRGAVLRRHFGDMAYEVVQAAVVLLATRQKFLPVPADVYGALRDLRGERTPGFAEAYPVIVQHLDQYSRHGDLVRLVGDVALDCGEGAARFVRAKLHELRYAEVGGEYGGAIMDRWGKDYAAIAEGAEVDEKVGLALEQAHQQALAPARDPGPRRLRALGAGDA